MAAAFSYKRRTFDEAQAIALHRFHDEASAHLSDEELRHCHSAACIHGGGPGDGWRDRLGFEPDPRLYYEIAISDWADEVKGSPPPRRRVRILGSRDRTVDSVALWWHPPAEADA